MFSLLFTALISAQGTDDREVCKELMDHIYSKITLQNLNLSLKRVNNKIVLAYASALKESDRLKINLRKDPELLSIIESMAEIDEKLKPLLDNNQQYGTYSFWTFLPFLRTATEGISYQKIITKWRDFQNTRPELFKSLEPEHLLDSWDTKTAKLIENYSKLDVKDTRLDSQLKDTANQFEKSLQDLISEVYKDSDEALDKTKKSSKKLAEQFNERAKKIFWDSLDDFSNFCDIDDIKIILEQENLACPFAEEPSLESKLVRNLDAISDVLTFNYLNKNQTKPLKPVIKPELKVTKVNYENINYNGSFCERSPNAVDTVVIHHSAMPNTETPQDINDIQVVMHENDRDSSGRADPWYMLGYNYVIQSKYRNISEDLPVFTGRPDNIRGAHAGAYVNLDQVDEKARNALLNFDTRCGWNTDRDENHTIDRLNTRAIQSHQTQLARGYVSANETSVGVLVTGNYAPDIIGGRANPGGYPRNGRVRYPSESTLRTAAKLICKLKKETHPNLRKISDHNLIKIKRDLARGVSYVGTCCPGTVYKRMNKILQLTKEECPEYNFALDISPEENVCTFLKRL